MTTAASANSEATDSAAHASDAYGVALRTRQPRAVERMIRDHSPAIRRLVCRMTAWSDESQDLVQDVFAAAIVALPTFRGESALETWLMRIAINRVRRHLRRRRLFGMFRRTVSETTSADAADHVGEAETQEAVRRAVAALPTRYREVIVLRYFEERTAQETAELLNERVNTVEVRLHRARGMLSESLARWIDDD